MKPELKYIELKTGYSNNGPAWIAKVEFSKSGKTIYFNDRALKGNGHGVCTDITTNEIFWVSGIKKNGQDRHWAGNGKILVDKGVINEYLKLVGLDRLDPKKYEVVEIAPTDKQKFSEIENSSLDNTIDSNKYEDMAAMSVSELNNVIDELKEKEYFTNSNNGVKYYTVKRIEAEKLLAKLQE